MIKIKMESISIENKSLGWELVNLQFKLDNKLVFHLFLPLQILQLSVLLFVFFWLNFGQLDERNQIWFFLFQR